MIRVAIPLFLSVLCLQAADVRVEHFITASGSGGATGADWANAWSLSDLNTAGNWGPGELKITAGETVYFSGGAAGVSYGSQVQVLLGGVTFRPGAAHSTLSSGHDGLVTFAAGLECNTLTNVTIDGQWSASSLDPNSYSTESGFKLFVTSATGHGIHWKGSWNVFRHIAVGRCGDVLDEDHGFFCNPTEGLEPVGTIIEYCNIFQNQADGINITRSIQNSVTNTIIRYNRFFSNKVDGVQITGGCTYTHNVIDGTGNIEAQHGDGIQGAGGRFDIAYNIFRDWPQAIFIESPGVTNEDLSEIRIFNNLFYRDDWTNYMIAVSIKAKFTAPSLVIGMTNLLVANNTIFNTFDRHGVRIQYAPTPDEGTWNIASGKIVNNIFWDITASSRPVSIDAANISSDADLLVQTNIFFNNEQTAWDGVNYSTIALLVASHPTFTGNTNAQPVFQNTNSLNFKLADTDVYAKGTGTVLTNFTDDFDGELRGASWSIGAYQYVLPTMLFGPISLSGNAILK